MRKRDSRAAWSRWWRRAVALTCACAAMNSACAQRLEVAEQSRLLNRAAAAVVGVRAQAVDDAR